MHELGASRFGSNVLSVPSVLNVETLRFFRFDVPSNSNPSLDPRDFEKRTSWTSAAKHGLGCLRAERLKSLHLQSAKVSIGPSAFV